MSFEPVFGGREVNLSNEESDIQFHSLGAEACNAIFASGPITVLHYDSFKRSVLDDCRTFVCMCDILSKICVSARCALCLCVLVCLSVCVVMLCYMDICIAPLAEGYSEALSA